MPPFSCDVLPWSFGALPSSDSSGRCGIPSDSYIPPASLRSRYPLQRKVLRVQQLQKEYLPGRMLHDEQKFYESRIRISSAFPGEAPALYPQLSFLLPLQSVRADCNMRCGASDRTGILPSETAEMFPLSRHESRHIQTALKTSARFRSSQKLKVPCRMPEESSRQPRPEAEQRPLPAPGKKPDRNACRLRCRSGNFSEGRTIVCVLHSAPWFLLTASAMTAAEERNEAFSASAISS